MGLIERSCIETQDWKKEILFLVSIVEIGFSSDTDEEYSVHKENS